MNAPEAILEKGEALSDHEIRSRKEWLIAPQNLLSREKDLSNGRCGKLLIKQSAYRLVVLVGVPLILAVYLLLQLHKLPNTSLSYSLLYAVISLLFNVSSSALLKVF